MLKIRHIYNPLARARERARHAVPALLILVLAALTAAGCGQFGKVAGEESETPTTAKKSKIPNGLISNRKFDAAAKQDAGCDPLSANMKDYGREHATDKKATIEYKDNPPSSGKHFEIPIKWGVYATEQPTEHWVHNLEHGQIVITYKGISAAERKELIAQRARAPFHIVLMPRKANPQNGIYYTAWRNQLFCERPSAEGLQYMIDEFLDRGPEKVGMDEPKDPKEA